MTINNLVSDGCWEEVCRDSNEKERSLVWTQKIKDKSIYMIDLTDAEIAAYLPGGYFYEKNKGLGTIIMSRTAMPHAALVAMVRGGYATISREDNPYNVKLTIKTR